MIKKNIFAASFAVLALLSSCKKEENVSTAPVEGERVEVNFSVSDVQTKLSAIASESEVRNLQVYVFTSDGKIETYGTASTGSMTLTCTTGEKTFAALVNAPALNDISSLTDLKTRKTHLTDNTPTSIIMEGSLTQMLSGKSTVNIPVSRCVSKVVLKSVSADFVAPIYRDLDFKVTRVMLTNVVGDKTILGDSVPAEWLNPQGTVPDESPLICDMVADAPVTSTVPYSSAHYLYCYPNSTEQDSSLPTWSPRHTRLVVSTTLGGETYHYPITLPQLKANHQYTVSLVVRRPGSKDVDTPIKLEDASFNVTVTPWTEVNEVTETI